MILTSADKRERTVIQDVQQYIKEAERQYNNIKNYMPLPNDLTKVINKKVDKTIEKENIRISEKDNLIKDKEGEYLLT